MMITTMTVMMIMMTRLTVTGVCLQFPRKWQQSRSMPTSGGSQFMIHYDDDDDVIDDDHDDDSHDYHNKL